MRETGWAPEVGFEEGLSRTVAWYRQNAGWVERVKSGEYQSYYERNYGDRDLELKTPRRAVAISMRVALDATPLTLSSGGLARYVSELHRALEAAFPEDEFPLVPSPPVPARLLRAPVVALGTEPGAVAGAGWRSSTARTSKCRTCHCARAC